jgi:hypothetical protein
MDRKKNRGISNCIHILINKIIVTGILQTIND